MKVFLQKNNSKLKEKFFLSKNYKINKARLKKIVR